MRSAILSVRILDPSALGSYSTISTLLFWMGCQSVGRPRSVSPVLMLARLPGARRRLAACACQPSILASSRSACSEAGFQRRCAVCICGACVIGDASRGAEEGSDLIRLATGRPSGGPSAGRRRDGGAKPLGSADRSCRPVAGETFEPPTRLTPEPRARPIPCVHLPGWLC